MWLAVGARNEHPDALRLDIRPGVGDVPGDIRHLPYNDCFFDGVELHHVLEHLERDEAPGALAELYRVLRPGGLLEISVPDLLKCAETLINGNLAILLNIYSPDPAEAQHHRWGYIPATLKNALIAAGFNNIEELHDDDPHSIRYRARK